MKRQSNIFLLLSSSLLSLAHGQTVTITPWMEQMLNRVNAERDKKNRPPLCYNAKLIKSATRHNNDMVENGVWAHKGSDGSTVGSRAADEGYGYNYVGENIAWGQESVSEVMDDWMGSDGHRANILDVEYTQFGAAWRGEYWTQVFGKPFAGSSEPCMTNVVSPPPPNPPNPPNPPPEEENLKAYLTCMRYINTNQGRVYKENCNDIQQVQCSGNTKRRVTVEFTKILMCGIPPNGSTVQKDETYLLLRGSAVKSYNNNSPKKIYWNAMTSAPGACARRTYDVVIDQCQDHFNAQLVTKTKNGSVANRYDTYMQRICTGLKASVTCTQNGVPCNKLKQCINRDVQYDYKFCIENTYNNHGISISKFYNDGDSVPYSCNERSSSQCKKTIAYIGNFRPEKIFPNFPEFSEVSYTNAGRKQCWTKSIRRNTCTNNGRKVPSATIEAYGRVTSVRPNSGGAAVSEFQECQASATFDPIYF